MPNQTIRAPAYAFDDTVKHDAIDPAVSLPLDKLNWMQNELVKAGNLKAPIDLDENHRR